MSLPEPPPPSFTPPGYLPPHTSRQAIWSVVLGVLGITCCTVLTGIPAIVLGVRASRAIKRSEGRLTGAGLATAGYVLGIASIAFLVAWFLLWVTGVLSFEGRVDL